MMKLDLELWQMFTVLTVILSIASTFMWLGLVSPRNIKEQITAVDKAKTFIYNQYQQDFARLAKISIGASDLDFEECKVVGGVDNTKSFDEIDKQIDASKSVVSNSLTLLPVTTNDTPVAKMYGGYLNTLTKLKENAAKIRGFQTKKAELQDKILSLCQPQVVPATKQEIISGVNELGVLDVSNQIIEQTVSLKNAIVSSDVDTPSKLLARLALINDIHPTIETLVQNTKQYENEFIKNVKSVESWERTTQAENTRLAVNLIYIYDA
jgi:hypothetical protein